MLKNKIKTHEPRVSSLMRMPNHDYNISWTSLATGIKLHVQENATQEEKQRKKLSGCFTSPPSQNVIPICSFKGNFVKLQESYENFGLIS